MNDLDIPNDYESILDNLLSKTLSDVLFSRRDFDPMEFCMSPAKKVEEGKILKKFKLLVEKCGGSLKFNMSAGGLNVIKFVHSKRVDFPNDYFLSQFIIDCVDHNRIQKLDNYRATKTLYPTIDPNDIIYGIKSWEDARKLRREICRGEVSDDFSDEEEVVPGTSKSTFKTSERRKFYSINEEREILNYILKKKYYFRVKGNAMWQKMESEEICGSRTWQSMKERYLHHIIPRLKQFKLDPTTEKKLLRPFSDEREGSFDDIESIRQEGEKKSRISPKKIRNNINNENQPNIVTIAIDDEVENNSNKQGLRRGSKEHKAEIREHNKEKETEGGEQIEEQEIEKNKEQDVNHALNKEQVFQKKQQKVDGGIKSNDVQSGTRMLKNKPSSQITNIPNQSFIASEINVNNDTRRLSKTKICDDASQIIDYDSNKDQESSRTRSGKNTSGAATGSNLCSDSNTETISSAEFDYIVISDFYKESCKEKNLNNDLVSIWDSSINENEFSGKANPRIGAVPSSLRPKNDVLEQTTTQNNGNSDHLEIIPDTENEELKRPVIIDETRPFSVESSIPVANLEGKVRCSTDEIDHLVSTNSMILYSANRENGLNLNESISSSETEQFSSDDNSVDTVICNYIALNSSKDLKSISHENVNNIALDASDVEIPLQIKKKIESPQKSTSSSDLEEILLSLVTENELEKESAPIAKSKNKREKCNDKSVPSTSSSIKKGNNKPKRRRISETESDSSDRTQEEQPREVESENDNTSTIISRGICRGEVSDDFSDEEEVVPGSSKSTFKTLERRKFYSISEEREILNYILKKKYYFKVKGNAMWQKMEKEKVCGSRTWQSMKERYLHHIIPRLKQFKLDPTTEKKLLSLFSNKKKGLFSDHDNGLILFTDHDNGLIHQEGEKTGSISPKKIYNNLNNKNHNNSTIVTIDDEEEDNNKQELGRDNKEQETEGGGPMIEVVPSSLRSNNEVLKQTSTSNDEDSKHLRILPGAENEEMNPDVNLDETQYFSTDSSLPVVNLGEKVRCIPNEIVHLDHLGSASSTTLCSSNRKNRLNLNESASCHETEKCSSEDDGLNTVTYNHNTLNSSEDLKSISHEDVNNIAMDASDVEIPLQIKKKIKSPQKSNNTSGLEETLLSLVSENELEEESAPTRSKNKRENKCNDESVPSTSSGIRKGSNRSKRRRISETESDSSDSVVPHVYSLRVKESKQSKKEKWPQISESDDDSDISTTISRDHGTKKYQEKDDLCILKYIYKNKLFDSVKGKQMWENMEKRKILPGRTWHSLKERFRKRILPRIKSYKNLSEKVVESFLECGGGGGEDDRGHKRTTLNYLLAEDECILEFIIKNKRYKEIKGKAMWISMSKFKMLKKRTWESLKNRFLQIIVPNLHLYNLNDEEKMHFQKVLENKKKQHTKYTRREDENILDFIIENKRYRAIKGKSLWISMADHFKDRSWESLRNRLLNVIIPNLPFYEIDKEAKESFKKALKGERKQFFKPPPSQRYKRVLRKKSDSNRKKFSSSSDSDKESSSQCVDSSSSDDETDEEKQDNNKKINRNPAATLNDSDDIYPSTGNEESSLEKKGKDLKVNIEETASRNFKDASSNDKETMQLRLRATPVKSNKDQDSAEKNEGSLDSGESGRKDKGYALTDDSDDTSPSPYSLYNIHKRKLFPINTMFIKLYEKTPAEVQSKRKRRKVWPKRDEETPEKEVGERLNQSFEAEQVDLQKENSTNSNEVTKPQSELNKTIGSTSQLPDSERRVQSTEGVDQPTQSTEPDNSEVRSPDSQLLESESRVQFTEGINQPIDVDNFEVRTADFQQISQTPTGRKSEVHGRSYSERRQVLYRSPLRKTRSESKRSSPRKSPRNHSTTLRTNLRKRKIQQKFSKI